MTDTATQDSNTRNASRRRIDKLGQIEIDETNTVACVVRNISEAGAMIMVRHSTDIPDRVVLSIPEEGFRRAAKVKWRRTRSIGVIFVR
jgi:hypothetical protein